MNGKTKIVLPAVLSVVFLALGVLFLRSYSTQKAEYEKLVTSAEQELAAAESERDAADPDKAGGAALWDEKVKEALADAQTDIEAMQKENAALDESIASAQKEIDALKSDENTAYYQQVYDTLSEGLKKVEGYLENGVGTPAEEDGSGTPQEQTVTSEGTAE